MSRVRILLSISLVAFLMSACGSSGGAASPSTAGSGASSAGSSAGTGAGSASAVAIGPITVTQDSAATAEQTIGPDGGSITAKAADGTTFALTVPQGALPSETKVTATPATLGGVDFPTYTVIFGPTGTRFTDWATLVITPPSEIPVDKQFMYQLNDDGTEFGAAFVDPKAKQPTILLDHFSGYGIAEATTPERAAMLSKSAADAEARISSEMAAALGKERQAQLLGSEDSGVTQEMFDKFSKEYEEQVIKPRLEAAGSSCEALQQAVSTVLGFERQKQLLGMSDSTAGTDLMIDVLNTNGGPCEEEAKKKCKAAKDPGILISYWLGIERQKQLLGMSDGAGFNLGDIIKKARAICAPKSYEASGTIPGAPSGTQLNGLICSLSEPFSLKMTGDFTGRMKFTPSSEEGGSLTYKATVSNAGFSSDGKGDYTVTFDDMQALATKIDINVNGTIHIPVVGDTHGGGPGSITLTPTEPCAEQQ